MAKPSRFAIPVNKSTNHVFEMSWRVKCSDLFGDNPALGRHLAQGAEAISMVGSLPCQVTRKLGASKKVFMVADGFKDLLKRGGDCGGNVDFVHRLSLTWVSDHGEFILWPGASGSARPGNQPLTFIHAASAFGQADKTGFFVASPTP